MPRHRVVILFQPQPFATHQPVIYHPNCSEVLVVAQGTIEHTAPDGKVAVMGPGDVASIPPNVVHHARNIGAGDAVVWISFSSATRETVGHGVGTAPTNPLNIFPRGAASDHS